ncbi:hypothetical protein LUZ61_020548 [Rhynchospora tenuis]|uniref:non-specific serine/threonine protein kinase n=1 Tax=Rhynchospora tenuis TaxID=198213 RepID=A0AAD6ENX2_9POAL|nr:hypothetical protein LUZ61_020548 [Rhynchospora tenuis]
MEKYEDLGAGNFEGARKMRNKETQEVVSVKFIPRGAEINDYLEWRILNHRSLTHPNVIQFIEVVLTLTHLAIIMEHADVTLLDHINAGPLSEDNARYIFQQLICGVSYCHFMQICNQDLKLENVLLNESFMPFMPQLKICDFDYTKSSMLRSSPQMSVGKLSYIAPEVVIFNDYRGKNGKYVRFCKEVLHFLYEVEQKRPLSRSESKLCFELEDHIQALSNAEADINLRRFKWFAKDIDMAERDNIISDDEGNFRDEIPRILVMAELADVWSCGVTLFLMLFGTYVFQDSDDPENSSKTTRRIMLAQYKVPDHLHTSQDCQQLLARIFVADPDKRIKVEEIRKHPWFLKNLPEELCEAAQAVYYQGDTAHIHSLQTKEEIRRIVNEARIPPPSSSEVQVTQAVPDVEEDIDWYLEMYVMPRTS